MVNAGDSFQVHAKDWKRNNWKFQNGDGNVQTHTIYICQHAHFCDDAAWKDGIHYMINNKHGACKSRNKQCLQLRETKAGGCWSEEQQQGQQQANICAQSNSMKAFNWLPDQQTKNVMGGKPAFSWLGLVGCLTLYPAIRNVFSADSYTVGY